MANKSIIRLESTEFHEEFKYGQVTIPCVWSGESVSARMIWKGASNYDDMPDGLVTLIVIDQQLRDGGFGKYYGTVVEGIFHNGFLNGFGRCLYELHSKIGHFNQSKRIGNNYMIFLDYTIGNQFSGWFDHDIYQPSQPKGVFSLSKAHRFFTGEDCFSNEEPFIEDTDPWVGGPIKFKD